MYRGLPTYRGPEVTHHGSVNMLQRPAVDIVSNPLSYFSRPRQSTMSTSPEQSRAPQEMPGYQAQSLRNNSVSNISAISSRPPSPPRATDSPVSMMMNDTEQFPVLDPADDPHNQPKIQSDDEQQPDVAQSQAEEAPSELSARPAIEPQPAAEAIPETPKKEPKKRFTINGVLFGGEKSHTDSPESTGKLRKLRRRTLSLGKRPEKGKSGAQESPTEEQAAVVASPTQVDGATIEDCDMTTHPPVRPLSVTIPSEWKGKQKEIHSAPVYARCSCCGKLKRPSGYGNELSPVLENENLRTNFSFDFDRTSESSKRGSSDSSRGKYIPIIPTEVGENDTRQATIEPRIIPTSPVQQPRETALSSPRRVKRVSDPPKFVRFASLHGRRNDTTVIDEEEEDTEVAESAPLMSGGEDQGNEVMVNEFVMLDESVMNRPVINSAADVIPVQTADVEQCPVNITTPEDSHRHSHAGSDSDDFFTPARGTTPVSAGVNSKKENEREKDLTPTEEGKMFLSLPQPSLGPAFARNSEVLKNYVLARSTSLILSDAGGEATSLRASEPEKLPAGENRLLPTVDGVHRLDTANPKDQKWLAEIMAV